MSSGADPLRRLREGGVNYNLLLNKSLLYLAWSKVSEALFEEAEMETAKTETWKM
jgi:hypothetical protein